MAQAGAGPPPVPFLPPSFKSPAVTLLCDFCLLCLTSKGREPAAYPK